jgi:hypothetical protein
LRKKRFCKDIQNTASDTPQAIHPANMIQTVCGNRKDVRKYPSPTIIPKKQQGKDTFRPKKKGGGKHKMTGEKLPGGQKEQTEK